MPMTAAAQQMFSIQAARDGDTDCSAVIQLTLDLAGIAHKETHA